MNVSAYRAFKLLYSFMFLKFHSMYFFPLQKESQTSTKNKTKYSKTNL